MSLTINYCRLCLQKIKEPAQALSEDSKILTLLTILLPGMDTSFVINSKLCNECFKCVQLANSMIEPVRENEQKILLNLQNFSEKSTCRLCLSNEKLEAAVCLLKNTNEEARHIIEMAIMDLDFDIFRKPVMCNNCWPRVKFIYLFKKKCFATEKILKYYCATNKINSLNRKELEMVSFSYQEKLQQFYEYLDKKTFLWDKNAGSICTYLNNFSNNEDDIFEEVPEVVNILKVESDVPKVEDEINYIEEKLCKYNESDENVDLTVGTPNLESLGNIHAKITSKYQTKNKPHDNNAELLNCYKCVYITTRKRDLQKHMRNHESLANTRLSLKCEEYPYETGEEVDITTCSNSLKNHMETHQTKLETFKCQKYDYPKRKRANLVTHTLIHQENNNFSCDKCLYRGKTKGRLVQHMLIHQKKYNFQCYNCSYRARTKGTLVQHMLTHQESHYNFQCDNCNYRAKTKGRLVQHNMIIHQENHNNFQCYNCSFLAKTKGGLVQHMLIHQKNHNFPCDKCNYQAKRKIKLVYHMLAHRNNYNFICDKCLYLARNKRSLALHHMSHQENYNFSCDKCNFQAKRKVDLTHHILRHQNGKKIDCKSKKINL